MATTTSDLLRGLSWWVAGRATHPNIGPGRFQMLTIQTDTVNIIRARDVECWNVPRVWTSVGIGTANHSRPRPHMPPWAARSTPSQTFAN